MTNASLRLILTGMLIVPFILGSVGCATVMSDGGGERPVYVTSQPEGATVYVRQGMREWHRQPGVTPMMLQLDPTDGSGDYQLRLELSGYEPVIGYLGSDLDPWLFGSMGLVVFFVVPGLVATGVDFATGAWKRLEQENMHFEFAPADKVTRTD